MTFRTLLLSILITLISIPDSYAQCPSGTIELRSQTNVTDFANQYNACNTIDGNLRISGNTSDLSSLFFLSIITGDLIIESSSLTSLDGLQNISSIGTGIKYMYMM